MNIGVIGTGDIRHFARLGLNPGHDDVFAMNSKPSSAIDEQTR